MVYFTSQFVQLTDYSDRTQTSGQWSPVTLSPCSKPLLLIFSRCSWPPFAEPAGGQEKVGWIIELICWDLSFSLFSSFGICVFMLRAQFLYCAQSPSSCFSTLFLEEIFGSRNVKTQPLSSANEQYWYQYRNQDDDGNNNSNNNIYLTVQLSYGVKITSFGRTKEWASFMSVCFVVIF